jgi:hypothetical protein
MGVQRYAHRSAFPASFTMGVRRGEMQKSIKIFIALLSQNEG